MAAQYAREHHMPYFGICLGMQIEVIEYARHVAGLSNANFRTAGYLLGEKFMPQLPPSESWQLAHLLVDTNPRAFLVTVLKSWVSRNETLDISLASRADALASPPPYCVSFFLALRENSEDVRKTLNILLPTFTTPEQAEWLMTTLGCTDPHRRISAFITATTPVTSFLLLNALHEIEDDRALLLRTVYYLIKKGDGLSFNLASLICACFGLDEVKGTFSLHIRPYELSRLLTDYSAFNKIITT